MKNLIEKYDQAACRGADWLVKQLQPDGCFLRPDFQADGYYKAPTAFLLTGHMRQAYRLMDWVKTHDLKRDGELRHFNQTYSIYKSSWLTHAAHRLGRFDVSIPAMKNILRWQAPCGGFYERHSKTPHVEGVCTSWAGHAMIYLGQLDAARQAGDCLISLIRQQPDHGKLYCSMTPEGKLIVEGSKVAEPIVLNTAKPGQRYYYPGLMMLFLVRLHLATAERKYLDGAWWLFEFHRRSASDAFANVMSGKSGVAAAILHAVSGDPRALAAARSQAGFLVQQQERNGSWRNPLDDDWLNRLDATAEFTVFVTEISAILSGEAQGGR